MVCIVKRRSVAYRRLDCTPKDSRRAATTRSLAYIAYFYARGLPLITYASRGGGGGGVNPNAYKCVQGGRGGLNMAKNTHFVRRLIESGIISAQRKVNG